MIGPGSLGNRRLESLSSSVRLTESVSSHHTLAYVAVERRRDLGSSRSRHRDKRPRGSRGSDESVFPRYPLPVCASHDSQPIRIARGPRQWVDPPPGRLHTLAHTIADDLGCVGVSGRRKGQTRSLSNDENAPAWLTLDPAPATWRSAEPLPMFLELGGFRDEIAAFHIAVCTVTHGRPLATSRPAGIHQVPRHNPENETRRELRNVIRLIFCRRSLVRCRSDRRTSVTTARS